MQIISNKIKIHKELMSIILEDTIWKKDVKEYQINHIYTKNDTNIEE